MKVVLAKRVFGEGEGGALAAEIYLEAFQILGFEVALVAESSTNVLPFDKQHLVKRSGLGRFGKIRRFAKEVRRYSGTNLIHSHEWVPGAQVMRLGGGLHSKWVDRTSKLALPLSFHASMIAIEQECFAHPALKLVIANSELVASEVREKYPECSDRLAVIYNPIRADFIEAPVSGGFGKTAAVFVGSGWERKGLEIAIRAIGLMANTWSLNVFGDDKHRKRYERLVMGLGLTERVVFHGVKPIGPEIFKSAACLVLPTLYDAFPNAALEALASGVPVISTIYSGTRDFGSNDGVITTGRDPESVAAAMQEVGCRYGEYERLELARRFRKRTTMKFAKELEALFSEFIT